MTLDKRYTRPTTSKRSFAVRGSSVINQMTPRLCALVSTCFCKVGTPSLCSDPLNNTTQHNPLQCVDPHTSADATNDWECQCPPPATGTKKAGAAKCVYDGECAHPPTAKKCTDAGQTCIDRNPEVDGNFVCACVTPETGDEVVGGPAVCGIQECKDTTCPSNQQCVDPDAKVRGDWYCECTAPSTGTAGKPANCTAVPCTDMALEDRCNAEPGCAFVEPGLCIAAIEIPDVPPTTNTTDNTTEPIDDASADNSTNTTGNGTDPNAAGEGDDDEDEDEDCLWCWLWVILLLPCLILLGIAAHKYRSKTEGNSAEGDKFNKQFSTEVHEGDEDAFAGSIVCF